MTPTTWRIPSLVKPAVARADGRLRDADPRGDRAERLAAVVLQRLDDPAVDVVDAAERRNRSTLAVRCASARDSYTFAAHFVNRRCVDRRYARLASDPGVPGERRLEQMTVSAASSVFLT